MKPYSRSPRAPSRLSDSVHHQLGQYALAASAAGVGMIALARPAEAKIVYTKIKHVIRANSKFNLDLNHDGVTDYVFRDSKNISESYNRLYVSESPLNGVLNTQSRSPSCYADALGSGVRVGPGRVWSTHCLTGTRHVQQLLDLGLGTVGSYLTRGNWNNEIDHYLGLRLVVRGKAHYGWARMSVVRDKNHHFVIKAVVTGYAYESIANKPIVTGTTKGPDVITVKSGSLGRLAQGSAGR
jgi:hypothetical protein